MCIVWADDVYLDLAIYSCLNKQIRVFWLVSSLSPIQFSSGGSSAEEVNFSSQHNKHAIIMLEEFFFLCKKILFSCLMTVISDPMFSSSFFFSQQLLPVTEGFFTSWFCPFLQPLTNEIHIYFSQKKDLFILSVYISNLVVKLGLDYFFWVQKMHRMIDRQTNITHILSVRKQSTYNVDFTK